MYLILNCGIWKTETTKSKKKQNIYWVLCGVMVSKMVYISVIYLKTTIYICYRTMVHNSQKVKHY